MLHQLLIEHAPAIFAGLALLLAVASSLLVGTVTITTIEEGEVWKTVDVVADSDADTQAVITHGMGVTPVVAGLEPEDAAARLSDWIVLSRSSSQVVIGKTTDTGSGTTNAQVRVHLQKPHSIVI